MLKQAAATEHLLDTILRSELLPPERLQVYARLADAAPSPGNQALADLMVRDGVLTAFQSRQLLAGRARGFFLADNKYKILDLKGSGRLGHLLLCESLKDERLVAVRMLEKIDRSRLETLETVVRNKLKDLSHQNLADCLDFDRSGPTPILVTEFLDGTSLHQIVSQNGPLPLARAIDCTQQAARGLEFAHARNLVHGDVNPRMLMLERSGVVKVLDLGLLVIRGIGGEATGFDAPELAGQSGAADARSDVYGLGATLFHLLTARTPGGNTPPIRELRPDLPEALAGLIESMLAGAAFRPALADCIEKLKEWEKGPVPAPSMDEMPRFPLVLYRRGLSLPPKNLAPVAAMRETESRISRETLAEPVRALPPKSKPPQPKAEPGALPEPEAEPASIVPAQVVVAAPESKEKRRRRGMLTGVAVGLGFAAVAFGVWWWVTAGNLFGEPPLPPHLAARGGSKQQMNVPEPAKPEPKAPPKDEPKSVPAPVSAGPKGMMHGSGSTFIRPAMEYWAKTYESKTGVRIKYDGIGSGRGIENMMDRVLDFGCSDAAMTEAQLAKARNTNGKVLHVPVAMGAVVATYNLPGIELPLRFTGPVLADIYLGKIKKWNHVAIAVNNPMVELPDLDITVVRRSDNSGTTFIWTEYLQKTSAEWESKVGCGNTVKWPLGEDAEKSDGMAKAVSRKVGAIGYVELSFALERNLRVAHVKNRNERFVEPSLENVTAAVSASLQTIPDDFRYSLTDAAGENSYPICGTTWLLIYVNQPADKGKELVKFVRWVVHDGQSQLKSLRYAALPAKLVTRIDEQLGTIEFPE